jgi:hypothetical protein
MYIPPSQYKTGLYSNGEYRLGPDPYIGPYWELINGDAFTGEKPSNTTKQIFLIQTSLTEDEVDFTDFGEEEEKSITIITESDQILNFTRKIPLPYVLNLSQQDIDNGSVERFFVKRNDVYTYMEISPSVFKQFRQRSPEIAWDLYDIASINWLISGDTFNVIKTNKKNVLDIESFPFNWANFSQIFKNDYLQFFQGVQENLYTEGGEYKTKDNKEYIGSYHIHPDKGPMVGEKHLPTPHEYLYQIEKEIPSSIISQPYSQQQTISTPQSTGGSYGGGGGGGY